MEPSYRTTHGFLGLVLLSPDALTTGPGAAVFPRYGASLFVSSARSWRQNTQTLRSCHCSRGTNWLDGQQEADAGLMKIGLGEDLGTPSWPSHLFGDWRFRMYAPILRHCFYNSFFTFPSERHTSLPHPGSPFICPTGQSKWNFAPVMSLPGSSLSGEQYFRAKIFSLRPWRAASLLAQRYRQDFLSRGPALRSVEDTPWL